MKLLFAAAIAVAWCIVFYHMLLQSQKRDQLAGDLKIISLFGLVALAVQFILALNNNELVSSFFYGVYFATTSWLAYYLCILCFHYTNAALPRWFRPQFMGLLLSLDTINLISNFVFHHVARYDLLWINNELFLRFHMGWGYVVHAIFCYLLLGLGSYAICKRVRSVPEIYKSKYAIVLVYVITMIVMNLLFAHRITTIDISVLLYAAFMIHLHHNIYVVAPQKIMEKTNFLVSKHLNEAYFIWDFEGNTIVENDRAVGMFGDIPTRDEFFRTIGFRYIPLRNSVHLSHYEYGVGDDVYIFNIQFEELFGKEKKDLVASFFVIEDVTEEIRRVESEQYNALHDSLTGFYNRFSFYEKVKDLLANNTSEKEYLLLVSDIRNFKLINDTFGSETGDYILKQIAERIRIKAPAGSVYARFEKDIFALFMEKKYFNEAVFDENFNNIFNIGTSIIKLENYYGIYYIQDENIPVNIMCDRAVMALKRVKGQYQNHFGYYDDSIRKRIIQETNLLADVDRAIEDGEFIFYLQGQVNPFTGKLTGAEALLRWQHADGTIDTPGAFLPILEKNGAIERVDRYIWEEVFRLLQKWNKEGHSERSVSVNISPKDFFFCNIYEHFSALCEKYDVSPNSIKLEITESAVMHNFEEQIELIRKLTDAGFIIEMDDFGSAYSSLNMLKNMPTKVLKLDQAFIDASGEKSVHRGKAIVESIVEMAHRLDMIVIAEGVEKESQVEFFKKIHCDSIQGYYYCKPIPVEEFEKLIDRMGYENLI